MVRTGDIAAWGGTRPTTGQMMARDIIMYMFLATPFVLLVAIFALESIEESSDEPGTFDITYMYALIVVDVVFCVVFVYRRWSTYSSILTSGVEVPGEVTSIQRSGDAVVVEYTYRWQAETMKSTGRIGGYIPKRTFKPQVGTKATLLVDPSKPTRFLVLDSVR